MLNISPSGLQDTRDGKINTFYRAHTHTHINVYYSHKNQKKKKKNINRRDEWYLMHLFTCGHANCANQLIWNKSLSKKLNISCHAHDIRLHVVLLFTFCARFTIPQLHLCLSFHPHSLAPVNYSAMLSPCLWIGSSNCMYMTKVIGKYVCCCIVSLFSLVFCVLWIFLYCHIISSWNSVVHI